MEGSGSVQIFTDLDLGGSKKYANTPVDIHLLSMKKQFFGNAR
jgi:hypothetical protein